MNTPIINLLGIPFDEKSSFLRGPAQAPPLIRKVLHNGSSSYTAENNIDITEDIHLNDLGDLPIEDYHSIHQEIINLNLEGPIVFLGGDHSMTYQTIKAIHQNHDPFDILLFDAHTDLYDIFEGDKYSHACPFARIMEEGLVEHLVQIGIRTVSRHQAVQAQKFGVEIITMAEIEKMYELTFERPLYISIDLDGFDPAYAPGVSHHEPGGLIPREIINFLHKIDVPVISGDIVEYNPTRDHQGITAALAAKLLKEMIAIISKPYVNFSD